LLTSILQMQAKWSPSDDITLFAPKRADCLVQNLWD
jgi:hypothetical protein